MAAPYEAPGLDYLQQLKINLQVQHDTNDAQITALTASNTALDAQLTLLNETIAAAVALTTLATPANFNATSTTITEAALTWDAVTNATGYTIQTADNSDFTGATETTTTTNSKTITGLTAGILYYFRVKATAPDWNDSDWAEDSVTVS